MNFFKSLLLVVLIIAMSALAEYTPMEHANLEAHALFHNIGRADPALELTLEFHVKQRNQKELEQFVIAAATPGNPSYGKRLTKHELDEMTVNKEGVESVEAFLRVIGASVSRTAGNRVVASATVAAWENALHCEFNRYHKDAVDTLGGRPSPEETVVRTVNYSLPQEVAQHVSTVFNTVQFPVDIRGGPVRGGPAHHATV